MSGSSDDGQGGICRSWSSLQGVDFFLSGREAPGLLLCLDRCEVGKGLSQGEGLSYTHSVCSHTPLIPLPLLRGSLGCMQLPQATLQGTSCGVLLRESGVGEHLPAQVTQTGRRTHKQQQGECRMGFRAPLPCMIPNPNPSWSSGNRHGTCHLDAKSQSSSLSLWEGLRAAISLDLKGDTLLIVCELIWE